MDRDKPDGLGGDAIPKLRATREHLSSQRGLKDEAFVATRLLGVTMAIQRNHRLAVLIVQILCVIAAPAQAPCCPTSSVAANPPWVAYKEEWFSKRLRGLGEPASLLSLSSNPSYESYRFFRLQTVLPSVSVRLVVEPDGASTLTRKNVCGLSHKGSPCRVQSTSRKLSKEQTVAYMTDLEQNHRLLVPIREKNESEDLHRSDWMVDWVKAGKYETFNGWFAKQGYPKKQGLDLALKVTLATFQGEKITQ